MVKKYGLLGLIFLVVLVVLGYAYLQVSSDPSPDMSVQIPRTQMVAPIHQPEPLLDRALQGDAQAQFQLGQAYLQGDGEVQQDDAQALEWLEKAAKQSHARASYMMGMIYDRGLGVAQDDYLAVQWYRQAAQLGEIDAQYQLALSYDEGKGIEQNFIQAYVWLDMVLRQQVDYPEAAHALSLVSKMLSPSEYQQAQNLAVLCFESQYQTCEWNEN